MHILLLTWNNITMDEQVLSTNAQLKFTQHMPKKLIKYHIKFLLTVDIETKYIFKVTSYLGISEACQPLHRLFDGITINLVESCLRKERNVITNIFFTACDLTNQ